MKGRFTKGQVPWNKGKEFSAESRRKMSEAKKGKPGPWKGKKRPELSGSNNPNSGKFGSDHPKWREIKKKTLRKSIRQLFEYRQWRSDIFTRDNFLCVLCGRPGLYIEADHYPLSFAQIINEHDIKTLEEAICCEQLWNINNGRTLCKECHEKTDNYPKQFQR